MNKKTLEAALKKSATESKKSGNETSTRTGLPLHWISAIFLKFQVRYPHKWSSGIEGVEELAIQEWSIILDGLTGEQITQGLSSWQESWPPSAPEFKDACTGKAKNGFGLDYTPECYRDKPDVKALPVLKSDPKTAKDWIEKMKKANRGIK